jgi:hypothetical protein
MSHRIGLPELLVLLAAIVIIWSILHSRGPFKNDRL